MRGKEETMIRRLSFDHTPKLLASRRSGTTEVGLFWSKRRHRAAVVVEDEATGEHFELEIKPDDDPLDVYNHPYPYATSRHLQSNARAA
jgi:hypothetical protein